MDENQFDAAVKLPLWRTCLKEMREAGFSYDSTWPTEYFEKALHCARDEVQFAFEMLSLRKEVEIEDGYYIRSEENGKRWIITSAPGHEDIAAGFDTKLRRYAVRSVNLRSATLMNPKAQLSDVERARMEKNLEKASVRLVLLSRSVSIAKDVMKHNPKLLDRGGK
jgi:hypothetical protein